VLDVGCGGRYAIVEIAKNFPRTTCFGVDIEPNSVKLARQLIKASKLEKRTQAKTVRLNQDYGHESLFGLVTLFMVLHEVSPQLKQHVIDSAAHTLAPDGTPLILDEVYPEKVSELRSEPRIFAVMTQWYEAIWGSVLNTGGEMREMVSKAGLVNLEERYFSRFYVLTADKPNTT
jgi:cyclopropane fatty-acyl-phospholipid synthase-like methyltransferase